MPNRKAKIIEISEIRGHRIALLEIYPVSYNPAKNIIRVAKDIQVEIKWTGANWGATYAKLNRYYSPIYEKRLENIIVNYDYYKSTYKNLSLPINYLIITPDSWNDAITPFAEWKRQKGYSVKVALLSEVGGGDTTAVRNYIKEAYDTCTVPPSFVLLVGDVDSIGYFIGGTMDNPATDLYYGTMDTNDYFPDIDVSRFSVTSETELDELIDKTIRYEKNEWTQGTNWCNKGYFVASSDGTNHEMAEGTHSYCMAKCRSYGMTCDSLWGFYSAGTPIATALNEGRSWVFYSGHSSTGGWQGPSFSTSDVHSLSNLDKVPFMGTFACFAGNYIATECFSESWIRVNRNGAIASFASSIPSLWLEDDILQCKMFDAAFDSEFTWAMGIINKGKLLYFNYFGNISMTRRYFEMYNLMGDGSVDIYWDEPHPITVSYSSAIPLGYHNLEITVKDGGNAVEGALVCVKGDSVFAKYTDLSGKTTMNMNNTSSCTLQITVTGHNLETYIGDCVVTSENFYVLCEGHIIEDSAGNGDGFVNPGEAIELLCVLKNVGSETSYGVEAMLSTLDSFIINLSDTIQSYGNIASGDTALSSGAYKFTVGTECPNGHIISFGLNITDDSSNVWTDSIHIVVAAPVIAYREYEVDDSIAPIPNGYWDAGEAIDLIITLENEGIGNATDVLVKLRTDNSYVTFVDSLVDFGDIVSGEIKAGAPYILSLSSSTPMGENVKFKLCINSMGLEWIDSFTIQTGRPGVIYADHDIGNVKFTVTCQGICGKESAGGSGSGFCYPDSNDNLLYIGSLWVGNSANYVVNRDYSNEGPGDWIVLSNQDGKLRMGDNQYSDQDGWAKYDDYRHPLPCGITVTQKSWAWQDAPYNDFVIMQYTIENNGPAAVNGLYVGQFMDFDLNGANNVGSDSLRRLVYQWSDFADECVGVSLLDPTFASNLSAISYFNYVSTNGGYIQDSSKIKFLNGALSFPNPGIDADWGIVASTGPFNLGIGEDTVVAIAILGGDSLNDLKYNVDMAQKKYDSLIGIETIIRIADFRFQIYPNPFTKKTILSYSLPADQAIYQAGKSQSNNSRLAIYDLAGRLVLEFSISNSINTSIGSQPITHKIVWDGKDSHNKELSSGIYFCRLKYGKYLKVQKLILLR